MSKPEEKSAVPASAESIAAQRMVSRRKMIGAGMLAVPVLMTLPTMPAWADQAPSTVSSCKNPNASPQTASCAAVAAKRNPGINHGHSAPIMDDPFGKNVFDNDPLKNNPFQQ